MSPPKLRGTVRRIVGFFRTPHVADDVVTVVAEGLGVAAGAILAALHPPPPKGANRASVRGASYGVGVWATNYYGAECDSCG